jgi:hypothetical protein
MNDDREVLYVADVAKARGISLRAARAYLADLAAQPGSSVRRVGNKLCISRQAFDELMPGAVVSAQGQFKQLHDQVQSIARAVHELRALADDSAEGVQSARMAIHELKAALAALTKKSTSAA